MFWNSEKHTSSQDSVKQMNMSIMLRVAQVTKYNYWLVTDMFHTALWFCLKQSEEHMMIGAWWSVLDFKVSDFLSLFWRWRNKLTHWFEFWKSSPEIEVVWNRGSVKLRVSLEENGVTASVCVYNSIIYICTCKIQYNIYLIHIVYTRLMACVMSWASKFF
jgi:hypothetical protein